MAITDAAGAERTAVLVAGGGPAGLAAAAEFGLHGVDCVVIEPRVEVSHAWRARDPADIDTDAAAGHGSRNRLGTGP